MTSFTSITRWSVGGKRCFAVQNTRECGDFDWLINKKVLIDGSIQEVIGVERLLHSPPWRRGEIIGIMVKKK